MKKLVSQKSKRSHQDRDKKWPGGKAESNLPSLWRTDVCRDASSDEERNSMMEKLAGIGKSLSLSLELERLLCSSG